MARGMSASELARVGRNVNEQGGVVDEQSIQRGIDQELSEERKEQVDRFKTRKNKARITDAAQKTKLRQNLIKAGTKSLVEGLGAAEEKGAFDKKPQVAKAGGGPEIAPVQVKAGAGDSLVTGKPNARLKMSGPTRKGPNMNTKDYMKSKKQDARELRRMSRKARRKGGEAETDSELLSILGGI